MKVHITNIYNFNKEDSYVEKQHKFAKAGCVLGFLEMGIFNYPVETDSERELSIRLDGVIASLEFGDTVFMQLPHLVDQCQAKGIETTLWIVNHPEVVDWAVKHRIDYISSDYPDKMKAYLNSPAVKKAAKKAGY